MSATQVIIVLHSDYFVIIALFFLYCKVFSAQKVKIFWKNKVEFLKKWFFLSFFAGIFRLEYAVFLPVFRGVIGTSMCLETLIIQRFPRFFDRL